MWRCSKRVSFLVINGVGPRLVYCGGRKAWQLTWFGTIPAQPPFVIHQPRTAVVRQCGGGSSNATAWRRQQQCDGAAIGWWRRWQHLWRKCIHWHCTSVFGSFKHHHDCILPLSLLDGYSYSIFVISNLSTLMQLTVYFCKICCILVIFIHHKLVTFEV